jgi:predicted nucleotidyltransferase
MDLQIPGHAIQNSLAGIHAYGLNTASSDEDFRGVFVADKHLFYNNDFSAEVRDASNNQSYFELGKFAHLLSGFY